MISEFGSYDGMRALVTGGLGFIGSHLAERLVDLGAEVTIVDSLIPEYGGNQDSTSATSPTGVEFSYSDIRDPWSIRHVEGQDFIFNLAGQVSHIDSMEDPETDLDINCKSQLSLLEACREQPRRPDRLRRLAAAVRAPAVRAGHRGAPACCRSTSTASTWSPARATTCSTTTSTASGAVSLRLTNTYGPHLLMKHGRQGFITVFIRRALEGEDLQVFGDGSQLRDFTYVADAVDAFLAAALRTRHTARRSTSAGSSPCRCSRSRALPADSPAGRHGRGRPVAAERKKIDIGSIYVDHARLTEATGWEPRVGLEEGLARTIAFYREHGEHYWN